MIEVTQGSACGFIECKFARTCESESAGGTHCEQIIVEVPISRFSEAQRLGLHPVELPGVVSQSFENESTFARIEICPVGQKNSRVVSGLRELVGTEASTVYVDSLEQIASLKEADDIATGRLIDPDAIRTELGFKMLEVITSEQRVPFPETRLSDLGDALRTLPYYEL